MKTLTKAKNKQKIFKSHKLVNTVLLVKGRQHGQVVSASDKVAIQQSQVKVPQFELFVSVVCSASLAFML